MYEDQTPLETFVNTSFLNPIIAKIISSWRVEHIKVKAVILQNFRELGINFVNRRHKKTLLELIIVSLKRSKEIKQLVKAAEVEEKSRKKSRHADV